MLCFLCRQQPTNNKTSDPFPSDAGQQTIAGWCSGLPRGWGRGSILSTFYLCCITATFLEKYQKPRQHVHSLAGKLQDIVLPSPHMDSRGHVTHILPGGCRRMSRECPETLTQIQNFQNTWGTREEHVRALIICVLLLWLTGFSGVFVTLNEKQQKQN